MLIDDEDEIPILIEAHPDSDPAPKRVPITLICGFLGAGKSTLLKWILTERHGYRIAVIMNEFGDTADIEAKAINISTPEKSAEETSEEFLELANGCLCCSIKDSGIAAIEQLMRRKGAFDYILLETTGLADPGPIAAIFWQNEEFATGLGKDIYLDGVVCVVDAVFSEKQIKEDTESEGIKHSIRQIGAADVILLNKSDLVSEFDLSKTESTLRSMNPTAPIHRTIRGNIDLSNVMGIDAYGDRSKQFLQTLAYDISDHTHESAAAPHHDHDHDHKEHVGVSHIIAHIPEPLSDRQITLLEEWIRSVLWEGIIPSGKDFNSVADLPSNLIAGMETLSVNNSGDETSSKPHLGLEVLRCKGMWWNEHGEQFILQGVRNLYDISKVYVGTDDGQPEGKTGKLVFIGKGLDEEVKESFLRIVIL